jgi:hypothetical protein
MNWFYPREKELLDEIKVLAPRSRVRANSKGGLTSSYAIRALEEGLIELGPLYQSQSPRDGYYFFYAKHLTAMGWVHLNELFSELVSVARNFHFWEVNGRDIIPFMSLEHLPELLACDSATVRGLARKRWGELTRGE